MYKKIFGGGVIDLSHNHEFSLPLEIDLLFDNKKLDALKYLAILYNIKKYSKKKTVNLEQTLYYYLVLEFENDTSKMPLINRYLRDYKNIKQTMIYLYNLDFCKVIGDITVPTQKIKLSLTEKGIQIIESWDSDLLKLYIQDTKTVMDRHPYETKTIYFENLLYKGVLNNEIE